VLSNRLCKKQTISLTDKKVCIEQAIRQYASQRLQSLYQKLCQLYIGPSKIEEIEHGIPKKADSNPISSQTITWAEFTDSFKGMFLYTRLVIDYLATNIFYSSDEIKTSVNQLPEKLADL
jgi:hypothetical protein